ncbi:hypothetical protein [uncultured Roseobacter sp.]|uniref:hypothetical protein n=1 Tax=uncultured Roseobacter sp. TaxID=114847 RepID=UPI002627F7D5|nr:hypothetical protein [uncultured Roseobacter sp.]
MKTPSETDTPVSLERYYAGVSPQLLARTRQMWSARGLDLDAAWRVTICRLRGYRTIDHCNDKIDSVPIDGVFMFDQAVIWVASLSDSASIAMRLDGMRLIPQQWEALHAVTFRMIEQLDAVRLLFLTQLPLPSMQIARSISENVDMALAFLSRPKLARRFVECATVEEANEFWRRHIAGGRAFRTVSQQLYRSGLEFDQSGEYENWRNSVKAVLGTAVHTSFHPPGTPTIDSSQDSFREISDCHWFVTFRLQEMCAYSHVLQKNLREDLDAVSKHLAPEDGLNLGAWTSQISEIAVDQLRWSLANGAADATPALSHGLQ